MSSIRLYVLGALAEEGEMHGHQLRQLAELEHIDQWTDVSVGALYGAIKRLAAEGLIREVRTEQVGGYPERIIWEITDEGRAALRELRAAALRNVVIKPDPFDLAMARTDPDAIDEVPGVIADRIAQLRRMIEMADDRERHIGRYLSNLEKLVLRHRTARLRAEVAWHETLLEQLPALLEDHHRRSKEGQHP